MSLAARLAVSPVIVALMTGCSSLGIESKKVDYKSASSVKVQSLEVPPDLTSPTLDDHFVVPDTGKGSTTYSSYSSEHRQTTTSGNVLPVIDQMRIERLGDMRWLVLKVSPDKLWGPIKDFWQELGFVIQVNQPEIGVMETDWAENRANIDNGFFQNWMGRLINSMYSTAERDKFRTRLETHSGNTEIYISHRGMYEIYITEGSDQTRWQPRPPEPEQEAEMLRRLMVYLGSDEERAQTALAETQTRPPDRALMEQLPEGAGQQLVLQDSFDRAWRRIGLALDRAGFTVEDRDRSKGLFFVRYVDFESEAQNRDEGLLAKLAFWRPSAPDPQTRYRISVKDNGVRTTIQVLSLEDAIDNSETGKKILDILLAQLK